MNGNPLLDSDALFCYMFHLRELLNGGKINFKSDQNLRSLYSMYIPLKSAPIFHSNVLHMAQYVVHGSGGLSFVCLRQAACQKGGQGA